MHLEGSHLEYTHRYDEIDKQAIVGSDVMADYDRTIHHTDRFLRELYKRIEAEGSPFVLIYFSDHGEIIGKGHGFMNEGIQQFEIPFVTLQSGEFPVDSIVQKYINPELGMINNLAITNIVSELMGYTFPQEHIDEVLEASKYIKHADQKAYLFQDLKDKHK